MRFGEVESRKRCFFINWIEYFLTFLQDNVSFLHFIVCHWQDALISCDLIVRYVDSGLAPNGSWKYDVIISLYWIGDIIRLVWIDYRIYIVVSQIEVFIGIKNFIYFFHPCAWIVGSLIIALVDLNFNSDAFFRSWIAFEGQCWCDLRA